MKRCPLRSETLRIAFLLLYTTGIRCGELTRLTLGDIDAGQQTLLIKAGKFHKSRILPLSESVAAELKAYLRLRHKNGLPMDVTTPVVWHDYRCPKGRGYNGRRLFAIWATLCASLKILTAQGKPPRLHDMRHSFAVNALLRWYRTGEDVQAKLPLLSTYLGHVSVVSTHYYLTFIEELRCEASTRFYQHCGNVVRPNPSGEGGAL
jgi:integrase